MSEPNYLAFAKMFIGESETQGANKSPFIKKMWCVLGWSWCVGLPYCGGFVAYCLKRFLIPYPKTAYRALDWAKYGKRCPHGTWGAIAVKARAGGGHVAFVDAVDKDGMMIRCVGANQGDKVSAVWYPASAFLTFRLPEGVNEVPAPVVARDRMPNGVKES